MVIVQFNTDNDNFNGESTEEIARILRKIATDIENGDTAKGIMDINGNRIGQWEFNTNFNTNRRISTKKLATSGMD